MKNILLTTNHPAPYIDQWLVKIEEEYTLTVIYNKRKDDQKIWKGFRGHQGYYYEDLNNISLAKLIKNAELLIVGGWTNKECFKTIVIGKFLGKKVGVFTDFPFHQNKYADFFKYVFLYRWLNYVFCATESTCEYIIKKYRVPAKKVKLFPYAVAFPSFIKEKKEKEKYIRVFIANNFIERKGYRVLFKALEKLQNVEDADKFIFDIAGYGEQYEFYREKARQIKLLIRFHGWCELEEYTKLKGACNVYIHASLEEPFGIPPLDAMACQKVVIVSDGVKSTDLLIENGKNGFIYQAENADALFQILKNLDTSSFAQIGVNARRDVIKKYSLTTNMKSIGECLIDK